MKIAYGSQRRERATSRGHDTSHCCAVLSPRRNPYFLSCGLEDNAGEILWSQPEVPPPPLPNRPPLPIQLLSLHIRLPPLPYHHLRSPSSIAFTTEARARADTPTSSSAVMAAPTSPLRRSRQRLSAFPTIPCKRVAPCPCQHGCGSRKPHPSAFKLTAHWLCAPTQPLTSASRHPLGAPRSQASTRRPTCTVPTMCYSQCFSRSTRAPVPPHSTGSQRVLDRPILARRCHCSRPVGPPCRPFPWLAKASARCYGSMVSLAVMAGGRAARPQT